MNQVTDAIAAAARVAHRGAVVLMPWVRGWPMTERAAVDALDQAAVGQVGLVLCGNAPSDKQEVEAALAFAAARADVTNVVLPAVPTRETLGAVWNFGAALAEAMHCTDILVVNNDVRLHPLTYFYLRIVAAATNALLVGALNYATPDTTWEELRKRRGWWPPLRQVVEGALSGAGRGGPDFSCFLLTEECWRKYRFDENLTYFGDNDCHRQLTVGGDGKRIFGACVPYWHFGSQTLALASEEERQRLRQEFEAHREYYRQKWGGAPGGEQFDIPWDSMEAYYASE